MKITYVAIRNFRSIKNLQFYPSDICALIGENNAGKTNILTALNFLLGEVYPSKRGLEVSDYFDPQFPIHIEVGFAANPDNIKKIWCTIPLEGQADVKMQYARRTDNYYLSNAVREKCALVYLDANRNLEYHLGHSRWTLFGRIIRMLDGDFKNTTPKYVQESLETQFHSILEALKTPLYTEFEEGFKSSFFEQLKKTAHGIRLEFRTFDPQNYYRSIQPILLEDGDPKNPVEAGQGMRNLILMALFRTYAKVFKGDAIICIDEPEIYLHPHARRSLAVLFNEMAAQGNQIFFSTHSGNFMDIEHFDHICVVEKCVDAEGDTCTKIKQVFPKNLLQKRQALYPGNPMNEEGMRQRYKFLCGLEHSDAFFARKIVLVEGETEVFSLPIYAQAMGFDFDTNGVSVVSAGGKRSLDNLYHLYEAFGIPIYLIFDNDVGTKDADLKTNEILLRLLNQAATQQPAGKVASAYAILEGNFEKEMKSYLATIDPQKYDTLSGEVTTLYGPKAGKGIVARYMALKLTEEGLIPSFIKQIVNAIRSPDSEVPEEEPIEGYEDIPF